MCDPEQKQQKHPFQGQSRVSHEIQMTEDEFTEIVVAEVLTEKYYRMTWLAIISRAKRQLITVNASECFFFSLP